MRVRMNIIWMMKWNEREGAVVNATRRNRRSENCSYCSCNCCKNVFEM